MLNTEYLDDNNAINTDPEISRRDFLARSAKTVLLASGLDAVIPAIANAKVKPPEPDYWPAATRAFAEMKGGKLPSRVLNLCLFFTITDPAKDPYFAAEPIVGSRKTLFINNQVWAAMYPRAVTIDNVPWLVLFDAGRQTQDNYGAVVLNGRATNTYYSLWLDAKHLPPDTQIFVRDTNNQNPDKGQAPYSFPVKVDALDNLVVPYSLVFNNDIETAVLLTPDQARGLRTGGFWVPSKKLNPSSLAHLK